MKPLNVLLLALAGSLAPLTGAFAADAAKPAETVTKPYPMKTCVVSGDAFGGEMGEPIVKVYNGREMKFCCKDCIPKYEKNPEKYNAKLDAAAKGGEPAKSATDDHHHEAGADHDHKDK